MCCVVCLSVLSKLHSICVNAMLCCAVLRSSRVNIILLVIGYSLLVEQLPHSPAQFSSFYLMSYHVMSFHAMLFLLKLNIGVNYTVGESFIWLWIKYVGNIEKNLRKEIIYKHLRSESKKH